MKKTNPIHLSFLVNVFVMVGIILISWLYTGGVYFPVDDPYISLKQGSNLLNGQFFTYSYDGEKTNSNTSVIYYFVSAAVMFFAKMLSQNITDVLESAVIVNLIFNFLIMFIFILFYKRLVSLFELSIKAQYLLVVSVSTALPVMFAFISGFETGLTMTLMIVQLTFFLEKRMIWFVLISMVLAINRPENIVVNFAYIFILFFIIKDLKIREKWISIFFLFASLFVVPLLNFYITGDLRSASAARVGWHGFLFTPLNLFKGFSIAFKDPGWLPDIISTYLWYLRIVISSSIILALLYVIFKNKSILNNESIKKWWKDDQLSDAKVILFVVMAAYVFLPVIIAGEGEWGRYVSPVLPILYLLLALIINFKLFAYFIFIGLNLIMIPFYALSHVNVSSTMESLYLPVGLKINEISGNNEVVAIDSAGYLSHFINGSVVDVYGLGTTRYMKIHGDFDAVYQQLRDDKIDYAITWSYEKPTAYLDSAHYRKAFGSDSVIEIYRSNLRSFTEIGGEYPKHLVIYKIDK
ncbi:MAG: hypothetical protein HOH98_02515 [Flavobacteriaceae bacterium]|nr:hypothetical protein [Flavobacteriaceae bacterium]